MKKLFVMLMIATFALGSANLYAAEKGAAPVAFDMSSENSIFVRTSDWFATIGKSDEDKQVILAQRKADRATKRAEKLAREKKAEMGKAAEKAKKDISEAGKGMGDKLKKLGQ